jgi:hypothetical protein
MLNLGLVTGIFSNTFIILTILMIHYAHKISNNMGRNCSKILVIP